MTAPETDWSPALRGLLEHMYKVEASDLYITAESPPVFRIDGVGYPAKHALTPDHVAALVREGFTDHVCLSQDHICTLTAPRPSFYVPPEHREAASKRREEISWQVWQRPYTYILTDFVPRLLERGVTDADIETIFVDNPRRLLTGA